MSDEQPELPQPDDSVPTRVHVRRAPRYKAFVVAGAVLGAVAGVVIALVRGGGDSVFSAATVAGYLGAIGLLLGALLGGAVAVLAEGRPPRR